MPTARVTREGGRAPTRVMSNKAMNLSRRRPKKDHCGKGYDLFSADAEQVI